MDAYDYWNRKFSEDAARKRAKEKQILYAVNFREVACCANCKNMSAWESESGWTSFHCKALNIEFDIPKGICNKFELR